MRSKKIVLIIIVGLCLVLFYSLHLMTSNIDKDRMLSSSESEDKRMMLRFKDNVVQLKKQIEENEGRIEKIKDLLGNMQVGNGVKAAGNKKDAANRNKNDNNNINNNNRNNNNMKENMIDFFKGKSKTDGEGKSEMLECPANTIMANNQATIQMSKVVDELAFENADGGVWKQGYPIEYPPANTEKTKLKVFVVPHSHCDPGWLKTFEKYFHDQTSHILNLMVEKLIEYPSMRFVYAEISYFDLWWKTLSTSKKDTVKKLLDEGRLEVVTGGWVMTDEANAHYFAMLDQMIEGNQWLNNQLGYQPKSGWSIDPFGHSPTMAYLLKRMGFKNMLIQRTHYSIKKELSLHKNLEFYWRQSWDNSQSTDMLCHMMPFYSYDIPHTCGPDPKICCQFDFRRTHGSRYSCPWKVNPRTINIDNVEERASTLLDQYRKKATLYNNNILLVPLGDDFRYEVPEEWDQQHNNFIKLFEFMNSQDSWNVEAKFATLSEYFDELRKRQDNHADENTISKSNYPILSGDFFVYADRDNHYWSGYFTSRPFYKGLDRELEHHQRTAEILFSLALGVSRTTASNPLESSDFMTTMMLARRNLGLFQHHDAITGTSKTHVVNDYGGKLLESIRGLKRVIRSTAHFLLLHDKSKFNLLDKLVFDVDEDRNQHNEIAVPTIIDLLLADRVVYFYNSLGQGRKSLVSVYVNTPHVKVMNVKGEVLESQVDAVWLGNDLNDLSDKQYKLHFVAHVTALGFSSFNLRKVSPGTNTLNHLSVIHLYNTAEKLTETTAFKVEYSQNPSIQNEQVTVDISSFTGFATTYEVKNGGVKRGMEIEFVRYGTTREKDRSGAYLFMPGGDASPLGQQNPQLRITKGPLLSEATTLLTLVKHTIRCYSVKSGLSSFSLDILNVVDIRPSSNTELAMRLKTDVANTDGVFYTDLNGFQVIKRKYYSKLPLQANFYPMPVLSFIEDENSRFTLLTGQSLGVASLKPGWLEVMQDRRLDQDDNRGMEQDVRDNRPTPNKFRLLFEGITAASTHSSDFMGFPSFKSHFASLDLLYPVFKLPLGPTSPHDLKEVYGALKEDLPCDVHLLNIRSMLGPGDEETGVKTRAKASSKTALILHKTAFSCDFEGVASQAVQCADNDATVSSLFTDLKVAQVQKATLNLLNEEVDDDHGANNPPTHHLSHIPPMEIKAYLFQFEK